MTNWHEKAFGPLSERLRDHSENHATRPLPRRRAGWLRPFPSQRRARTRDRWRIADLLLNALHAKEARQ